MGQLGFLNPELMLALIPLGWVWWITSRREHIATRALRAALMALVVLLLAGPYLRTSSGGHTVIFAVDRSASMPEGSLEEATELIELSLEARGKEDVVRVISFGEDVAIESTVSGSTRGFREFQREVGPDGSSLAAAIETGLSMLPEGQGGSLVLLTDGLPSSPRAAEAAALRAAARGVRIDARELGRKVAADTAVERIDVPGEVDAGEPFFVTAWIRSDEPAVRTVRLLRGADLVVSRRVELPRGRTRIRFPARISRVEVADFRVELAAPEAAPAASLDRVPENDVAMAAVRAIGARPVLVINHDGEVDTLTAVLRGAGIPAVPVSPERSPMSLRGLDSYRAVVIENVSAARVGLVRMQTLVSWVQDHGGGLMMTGGQASFGSGGYFHSPLDGVLPVSMELRQEHRKLAVALSVTLDRSGSMAAPVDDGRTKMDLANAGTVAALEMLSSSDSASVIAVDSSPHVVLPQGPLDNLGAILAKVRGIQSQGGGIYTATALMASANQLKDAPQGSRHVILFADAADAEEQTETPAAIKVLRNLGATVSVIALGSETDSDAAFLRVCAAQGGGEAYFTTSPTELPRLFAMETQSIARSTFVEDETGARLRPELFGLGEIGAGAFPNLFGYNLTYLSPGASLGAVTTDEYSAPIVAFHRRGLGRVAALPVQLGGTHNTHLADWDGYASLLVTLTRWLTGVEPPEGVFASTRREGRDAVFTVEFDPGARGSDRTNFSGRQLSAVLQSGADAPVEVALERVAENVFEGRSPLPSGAIALGTVSLAGEGPDADPIALPLPPLALPYSPEFERPTSESAGARLLGRITRRTGGVLSPSTTDLFRTAASFDRWKRIAWPLLLAALLCLVLEIAGRRLGLWETLARAVTKSTNAPAVAESGAPVEEADAQAAVAAPEEDDAGQGLSSALDRARASSRSRLR